MQRRITNALVRFFTCTCQDRNEEPILEKQLREMDADDKRPYVALTKPPASPTKNSVKR